LELKVLKTWYTIIKQFSMINHMKRRVAVRGIAILNHKLLCVRLNPYDDAIIISGTKEWWCLPGGTLEAGESVLDCAKRELIEETAITPSVGNLLYIQQFSTPDTNTEHMELFFHIKNPKNYLKIDLSKASHGSIEIAEVAFIDPKNTNVLPSFLRTEDIEEKILRNDPPKIFNFIYA
jgi:8-oxo-dGTP diphosphatase